ncbi:MAG: hypothetical protein NTW72_15640 [Gemmatimonadetes bacterium]|nr:hypothetical protein [Gemmatimonadota bacterium]
MGDLVRFGSADERWLRDALRLEQLVTARALRTTAVRTIAKESLLQPSRLLALTERIEAAGALVLSFNMLESARRVWDITDAHAAGMALFHQARICRTMGATDRAEQYYASLIRHALRRRLPDLRGRALVGRGVLHGMRGELAAAYRAFAQARKVARGTPSIVAAAYHGEMAAALAQGDFSRAILAGTGALHSSGLAGHEEAAVLINIAAIALRVQQPRAAAMVLRRAMRRTRHPRLRLHALGKSALAAAAMGLRDDVAQWARRLTSARTRVCVPAEELEARSELAQAWLLVGETARARRLAQAVRAQAVPLQLSIIVGRCDAILRNRLYVLPPVRLSRPAQHTVLAFEAP